MKKEKTESPKLWWAEQADRLATHRAGKKWVRPLFAYRTAFGTGTIEACLLARPLGLSVGEITKAHGGGVSQPQVSNRLKTLSGYGFLARAVWGRSVEYSLNAPAPGAFRHLTEWIALVGGKLKSGEGSKQYAYQLAHAFSDSLTALIFEDAMNGDDYLTEPAMVEKWGAKKAEVAYCLEKLAVLGLVEKRPGTAGMESPDPKLPRGGHWVLTGKATAIANAFVKGCAAIEGDGK